MDLRAPGAAAGRAVARAASVALAFGCGAHDAPPEDSLLSTGLFADAARQIPAEGVLPYEVTSVLYADETVKLRFLALPEGGRIGYRDEGIWEFPEGTTVIKTFAYPRDYRDASAGVRLLETRLIVRQEGRWRPDIFVWNETQTDAVRELAGATVPAEWIDARDEPRSLDYRVPNRSQCFRCHASDDVMGLLGPKTLQLDRANDYGAGPVNQIDHMDALGLLDGDVTPAGARARMPDPFGAGPLDARARAYLDANCAHCHRPGGAAEASGLDLRWEAPSGTALGICKPPVAAGRGAGGRLYDIVPGVPDDSILVFRMASTEPGIKMPELPTQTVDREGLALVAEWIAAMDPAGCD